MNLCSSPCTFEIETKKAEIIGDTTKLFETTSSFISNTDCEIHRIFIYKILSEISLFPRRRGKERHTKKVHIC